MELTRLGGLGIYQPQAGYRFSIDSILLAFFAPLALGRIADLGSGCGILPLLLARRGVKGPFTAVEMDTVSARCCQINLAHLPASVLEHDMCMPHVALPAGGFKMVIANPPFGQPGRGRISLQKSKASARHQLKLTWEQLWRVAAGLLPPQGKLILCLPPRCLVQAFAGMEKYNLVPKRLRLVHGRGELPAKIALLEAVKDAGMELRVEPPFILYQDKANTPGPELAALYEYLRINHSV
ncbi:MAG: methyltransferase [Desulfarculales bacterium]|nr:methyltransferase [Desulfarculales bacterium]